MSNLCVFEVDFVIICALLSRNLFCSLVILCGDKFNQKLCLWRKNGKSKARTTPTPPTLPPTEILHPLLRLRQIPMCVSDPGEVIANEIGKVHQG